MNSRYIVVDRETGNRYDGYKTEKDAMERIRTFQMEDVTCGNYYPFRYKIVRVEEIRNVNDIVVGQREVFEGVML